tara:strand:+ start:1908 stop:3422 length:1515 start_codon:yes stop_codon:yes gene_type:complete
MKEKKKLWSGRFQADMDQKTQDFTESTKTDLRLVEYDIWGSQTHAIMLAKQKIISNTDLKQIILCLDQVDQDFKAGIFRLDPKNEDVHMNVELYLIETAGVEFGGKLHTARSRNDQILTDVRLYLRQQVLDIQQQLSNLCRSFLSIADQHYYTVMPGYTHTQHAQPISLGFWATAYVSKFLRDLKRFDSTYTFINQNPLGAAALAGTSFPIDRGLTAKLLGFDGIQEHALDVISSRDFILEILSTLSILMVGLSRFCEEIIYWTTYEFRIAALDDQFASGSSIMPQKKNADIAELTRGRTGRVIGALIDVLTNLKGLPMGYNRDLQEDKPPLWQALDVVKSCLAILPDMLGTTNFDTVRMEQLCDTNFIAATELANYLVSANDIPFRQCHEIVGNVVGELSRSGNTFADWDQTQHLLNKRGIDLEIDQLQQILDPVNTLQNNRSVGGTSPKEVKRMSQNFSTQLDQIEVQISSRLNHIDRARKKTRQIIDLVLSGQQLTTIEID